MKTTAMTATTASTRASQIYQGVPVCTKHRLDSTGMNTLQGGVRGYVLYKGHRFDCWCFVRSGGQRARGTQRRGNGRI